MSRDKSEIIRIVDTTEHNNKPRTDVHTKEVIYQDILIPQVRVSNNIERVKERYYNYS